MGRLIDADKLNEEFDDLITTFENTKNGKNYISKEELLECLKILRGCVEEQPTAYDISNVVAELEDVFPINPYPNEFTNGRDFAIKKAIDIVRKGGINAI